MILYGKDPVLKILTDSSLSERFPHAVLFFGEEGVGRKTLAAYYAKLSVCIEKGVVPCDKCPACKKADNNVHPDIVYVKEITEGDKYKIESLRNEIRKGYFRPNDGDTRVFIFSDIDTMTPLCQNTLLKFIEEPEPFNRFAFTATSDRGVLPTIRSRITAINVPSPTITDSLAILAEHGIEGTDAKRLIDTFGININACLKTKTDELGGVYDIQMSAIKALSQKNEFLFSAALSKIKKREVLIDVLKGLLEIMRDTLFYSLCSGASTDEKKCNYKVILSLVNVYSEKQLRIIISYLERYINETEFNPNIALAATVYSSEISRLFYK